MGSAAVNFEIEPPQQATKFEIEPPQPNAGLAPAAGPSKQMNSGEGPIAREMTSFETQMSQAPGNAVRMLGAKHWPIIDSHNWHELGEDIKSLNPIVQNDTGATGGVDIGATAANVLPLALGARARMPEGALGKVARTGVEAGKTGLKIADIGTFERGSKAINAIGKGASRVRDIWKLGEPPIFPGAPLPDNPGEFPGTPLPEAPPRELSQAGALMRGVSRPIDPAAGLGNIPQRIGPSATEAPPKNVAPPSYPPDRASRLQQFPIPGSPEDAMETRNIQERIREAAAGEEQSAASQEKKEWFARNQPGKTKSELTGQVAKPVRYTKTSVAKGNDASKSLPAPGTTEPRPDEDLTPLLRKSVAAAKSKKKGN